MPNGTRSQAPALRLVGGDERPPVAPPAGWSTEPDALLALAVALEAVVGEGPDPYAEGGMTPALQSWFDRYGRAADILVEVAGGDASLLRSTAPARPDIGDDPPGASLLGLAAITAERRDA